MLADREAAGNSDIVDDIYVLNGNQFAMVVCWGGWRRNGAIPYEHRA